MNELLDELRNREQHLATIGFVKPLKPVVETIKKYSPLIEIGAGTGALAWAVNQSGGRVVPTDSFGWQDGFVRWKKKGWVGALAPVIKADASRAVRLIAKMKQRVNLLCSWPSYDEPWCGEALALLPRGRFFVFIGEGEGGCTGDDSLFELLERDFVRVEDCSVQPWFGIHDHLTVYIRI